MVSLRDLLSFNDKLVLACALAIALSGCEREARRFNESAAKSAPAASLRTGAIEAGGAMTAPAQPNPYEENAYAVSQGQRLYGWYNCAGCHARGGGGSGPALMDDKWIYGHEPADIFRSIVEGRPNGMPAFGGRISEPQVWQLVAYVRSLSGWIRKDVAPARDDGMQVKAQEQATDEQTPRSSGTPASSERP